VIKQLTTLAGERLRIGLYCAGHFGAAPGFNPGHQGESGDPGAGHLPDRGRPSVRDARTAR
jgi:hypothetical protein